ncbi:MAG: CHAT domain-containing protein [Candidatus Accumulibacter phosphatis]|nr:CHAT domain-containing protein [Candidatus Accumulibacter phosphatis]
MSSDKTYLIRGTVSDISKPSLPGIAITSARRVVPGSGRDAALGELTVRGDEAVRLELANGFVLWSRADDLIREHGRQTVGRDGGAAWEIDTRPRARAADRAGSRGWLGLGVRALEFFGVDLTGTSAAKLGSAIEARLLGGNAPGIYRCDLASDGRLTALADDADIPGATGPLLVFLHGTASSFKGSYGKLWEPGSKARSAALAQFAATYGERVYTLEHRSLTVSPIGNALDLAKRLPPNAELHLVSHSRGGLVGELLCLGERDRRDDPLSQGFAETLFKADRTVAAQLGLSPLDDMAMAERDQAYAADRAALVELLGILDAKAIRVRRFVRVACPARGTTLASGRLDRWLSVLKYFVPDGVGEDLLDFLLAVLKERTDPRTLPGLEAMLPGSALTRLLQHPQLLTHADLTVIAGDLDQGDSLWSQIKLLASDWFYGADHDLVVNTGSMYGGIRRPEKGARFLLDRGAQVNHFSYFLNERSVRWLQSGLGRADGSDGGFQPLLEARSVEPRWREAVGRSRAATTPRPLAVVLPGTMGSMLKVSGEKVWLDYWALFKGGLGRLRMGRPEIEAVDLLGDFYGPLLEFLARSHRVEILPYDWRLSVRDAARKLVDKLELWLPECERQQQPVHLVAHSMGGLVVRAMIADGGRGAALWRRIVALPNSRFMMLGTPNLGSHEAVRWLTGTNPTEAKLSLLDIAHSSDEIVDIVRNFPGLLELLPFDDPQLPFAQQAWWTAIKQQIDARWPVADAGSLAQARSTWELLRQAPPDPNHMVYIAGCQEATVVDYRIAGYPDAWLAKRQRLEFLATAEGDGTVTWRSGLLREVPTWYVEDTAHDELCAKTRAFPGYLELLTTGKTTRLSATPPGRRRDEVATPPFVLPVRPQFDGIPSDVRGFGFGVARPLEEAPAAGVPVLRVRIVHGDLAYVRHPVVVGHYQGDTIVNAEQALDERLDQALTQRLDLGLYPGPLGSHALFFNTDKDARPGGAVVVGLGQIGELSPGLLIRALRDAMLDFAIRVARWPDDDRYGPGNQPRSAALSCLLVGTGAGGGISARESLAALLHAATAANGKLMQARMEDRVVIDHLEIVELMHDVAIGAARALEDLLQDGQLAIDVEWPERTLVEGDGGHRRVVFEELGGWWQRLDIGRDKASGMLRFVATTNRARAEETLATGQLALAEGFVRQASQSPAANAEVAKTLFEMLLPNRLKELAPRQDDLVLLVDRESACFPWELLEDRWSHSQRPPAIEAGLVRQFKTARFRPHPGHASAHTAFVVGNPDVGKAEFCELPGARREAQKVVEVLGRNGYRSIECIDEKSDAILSGLHKEAWRILHLAGHGVHEHRVETRDGPSQPFSGMVIGGDVFLTPGDVEQMRWVPELVFINCCHLGKTASAASGGHSPQLAANLAVQFIEMGVRAVVAAGWAVDDAAAETFCESFYTHLLQGLPFGESVRLAREAIWVRFPEVNTWGAYQCYGDPAFRLHADHRASDGRRLAAYRDPSELVATLDNLGQSIRMEKRNRGDDEEQTAAHRSKVGDALERMPQAVREAWLKRADVAAAIGLAWGETGDYAQAVEWLDKALLANVGDCPLRVVEQCANFNVRLAGQRWQELRNAAAVPDEALRHELVGRIERAIGELALIVKRAPTVERLNLLGSACKRLTWIVEAPPMRLEAVVNMANFYFQAFELSQRDDPYPFSNWALAVLIGEMLGRTPDMNWHRSLDDECQRMIELARRRNAEKPNFWSAVGAADCLLVQLLAGDGSDEVPKKQAEAIVATYRLALQRGASPREAASVREHLDFVIAVADQVPAAIRDALATIRDAL